MYNRHEQALRDRRYDRDNVQWVTCQLGYGECCHDYCVYISKKNIPTIEINEPQRLQTLENSVKYLLEKQYSKEKKPTKRKGRFD